MRVKSSWFKSGRAKTPQEVAGAAAFIAWRIGQNALNNMRKAGFDIAVGPQYFEFLSEFLVFLVQLADRIGWRHLDEQERIVFTTELANRVGQNLAENWCELLGGEFAAHKAAFIARLNSRADVYADFLYEKGAENFSFMRQLGEFLQEVVEERDRIWVTDQVIACEAPEAVETLERAMSGLLELEPKKRAARGGTGGD